MLDFGGASRLGPGFRGETYDSHGGQQDSDPWRKFSVPGDNGPPALMNASWSLHKWTESGEPHGIWANYNDQTAGWSPFNGGLVRE